MTDDHSPTTTAADADVLVVIVSTDDGLWLRRCFDALAQSRYVGFETLLVLNDCGDNSELEAGRGPRVRVLKTSRRCGFAEANNHGIRHALESGFRYVFLLNPDTMIHPDAILALRGFLQEAPSYGIAGSFQTMYESKDWASPNRWSRETLDHARLLGHLPRRQGAWTVVDHYYVQGAALMLRSDLVPTIGMLDPLYGTFYEETDLCRRCLFGGYEVGVVLESRVKHFEGGHWRKTERRHTHRDVLFLRNQFLFFMSAREGTKHAASAAAKTLLQQLRGFAHERHDVRLSWWQYPVVLTRLIPALRFLRRLQRRNATIRSRTPLSVSDYAIGPTSH